MVRRGGVCKSGSGCKSLHVADGEKSQEYRARVSYNKRDVQTKADRGDLTEG